MRKQCLLCYGAIARNSNNDKDVFIFLAAKNEKEAIQRYKECIKRNPILRAKEEPCIALGGHPASLVDDGFESPEILKEFDNFNSVAII